MRIFNKITRGHTDALFALIIGLCVGYMIGAA